MNYQYVFHGVEQDAPASLRVREREDWPIEGGRAHTHRGSAFGAYVRTLRGVADAKAVPRVGHERGRGREFWVSETRKKKVKRRKENG